MKIERMSSNGQVESLKDTNTNKTGIQNILFGFVLLTKCCTFSSSSGLL